MSDTDQKILQYLNEAHASERALTRVLESQIAVAPGGRLRTGLVRHLEETKDHAQRLHDRRVELGQGTNPLSIAFGLAETVTGQVLALGKTPIDLVRGSGGAEKVLKNTKDACATEALEIATYTALERLAREAGDDETAELAVSIREDEQRMLGELLSEIPALTSAVVDGDYDLGDTGAGEAVRETAKTARRTAERAVGTSQKAARRARKVPGVARAEGQVKGAVASEKDLAIAGYDALTADEVNAKLPELSQIDLAKVESYERKHQSRITILNRVRSLRGDEPWAGYDELNATEVRTALAAGDDQLATTVRSYEQSHKDRAGVVSAAERELSKA